MQSVNLGPMSLSFSHLLLILAFILALLIGGILGRRYQVAVAGYVGDIFISAMVAARLGFVIGYFEYYQDNLIDIIDIRDGGFDVVWGIAGALASTAHLLWRHAPVRRPLAIAASSGLAFWVATAGIISLIELQARGLPPVNLTTMDNRTVAVDQLAPGKPLVINLWATWCPPCIREMPVLEEAQARYPDVQFVFANQREQPETIRQFLDKQSLVLENLYRDAQAELARAVGGNGLPTTLFYNADGQLVDSHMGELSHATLARALQKIRSEPQ